MVFKTMKKSNKNNILSPPFNYWLLINLFLTIILMIFLILLIRERLFFQEMKILLEKYKINLNSFSGLSSKLINSHLSEPINPSSSSEILYLKPENFTLNRFLNQQ